MYLKAIVSALNQLNNIEKQKLETMENNKEEKDS